MLQGSLDNFALDEVLGLLSSTTKTGKLDLKGNRGSGMLRLLNGCLVDATASNTANGTEPEDVLFELLRFGDGTFNFTSSDVEEGNYQSEVQEVLGSAERRLADWRTIEAVVPSLRHQVSPVPTLAEDEVNIARQEWMVLMTVAGGCPVSTVCDELGLGEVEGSRQIKGLAERGLVRVTDPRTASSFRRQGVDSIRTAGATGRDSIADEPSATTKTGNGLAALVAKQDNTPDALAPSATDRRARRPAHPSATTTPGRSSRPVGLRSVESSGETGTTAGEEAAEEKADPSSHGGLLMRYLKSDD